MKFEELDDVRWSRIESHLPPKAKEGKPRADDRRTVNAILYVLLTGCRWADLPERYGDDSTANRRLRRWERTGVWKRVMDALVVEGYRNGRVKLDELSVDSSTIRARKGGSSSATTGTTGSRGRSSTRL